MSVHYALSYQYFQFMYITCIYLSYHCLGWYTVRIWVFVCVCCAAPDKLTSPPPFTGLGALHFVDPIMRAYLSLLLLCTFTRTSSFTVACSGLTPISKISTRAFVAYSWFGPPLCPFAGVY